QRQLNNAYENSLLFYEHTWGGSLSWITHYLPPRNKMGYTDSITWGYGEKWKQLMAAGKFTRNIESWEEHSNYEQTANSLATGLLKEQLTKLANDVNADIAYNPLPWERDGIPASGYKVYAPAIDNNVKSINDTILENNYFKIVVSPFDGS